jgi:leukotriene-A4 hydrolase
MKSPLSILCSAILLVGCANSENSVLAMKKFTNDAHSCAKPNDAYVSHLDWVATVDFSKKIISASAQYHIVNQTGTDTIYLDTDGLNISKITVDSSAEGVAFKLHNAKEFLGQALAIPITAETQTIQIHYKTAPSAAALLWVEPSGTAGKQHPFLFTQSQAILARTWVPCQDSPGIRFTYTAKVRVPKGLMALMSAENPQHISERGIYEFRMTQPIPAYLMALAVGNLQFEALGKQTGVYAEPELLEAAAYEFAETEDMLHKAEALYGKYAWERYDLIVLPPSFPFGGMENPRLTFATPTIIAGDRSLTALVAHELAHSWSGNLVTNATWDDFWLNEGFTVYFERRIMEAMYGTEYSDMLALLGKQDLEGTVASLGADHKDTHLKLELTGRNPDDGMTDIAYEKGYFFLRLLEETFGREAFDQFLLNYFQAYSFKVTDTESFIEYLNTNLFKNDIAIAQKVNAQEWIYGPGIPANCPEVSSAAFAKVDRQLALFAARRSAKKLKTENWNTHQWLHFIRGLADNMSIAQMEDLDEVFKFTNSTNRELQCAWYEHCITHKYVPAKEAIKTFLVEVGRRKFLTPLYSAMVDSDQKSWSKEIYKLARPGYHAVSVETLDALLN